MLKNEDLSNVIQENYNLINFCDYVDTPFILLEPGQEVTLSLFEGETQDDYISITGDEFYEFEITTKKEDENEGNQGSEKKDKTTTRKITAHEKLFLKVKCLKESLDKTYYFLHTGARGPRELFATKFIRF